MTSLPRACTDAYQASALSIILIARIIIRAVCTAVCQPLHSKSQCAPHGTAHSLKIRLSRAGASVMRLGYRPGAVPSWWKPVALVMIVTLQRKPPLWASVIVSDHPSEWALGQQQDADVVSIGIHTAPRHGWGPRIGIHTAPRRGWGPPTRIPRPWPPSSPSTPGENGISLLLPSAAWDYCWSGTLRARMGFHCCSRLWLGIAVEVAHQGLF